MRPRHPHAAESGVGKYTARESECVQACAAGKERVTNARFGHSLPGAARRTWCGHVCNTIIASSTLSTGTAPACDRPLAPRYGSDLLTLRLLSLLQRGDVVFHAASMRRFDELCQVRSLPAAAPPLRAPLV